MDRFETVGPDEIASLLATNRKEITREDAQRFIEEWIAIITDVVAEKGKLEVNDFGTFSLAQCREEETNASIAAGESEVPCFYRVDFTPHDTLRKSVNSSFIHFEPSLLNEGVTFGDLPEVEEGKTDETVSEINRIKFMMVNPTALNPATVGSNPLSESLNQLTHESEPPQPPAVHQPTPPRSGKLRRRRERSRLWIPILGGAAIIVAGLFFFNTTERQSGVHRNTRTGSFPRE